MRVVKASICFKGRMAFEWSHKHYGAIALKVEDGQMNLEKRMDNHDIIYVRNGPWPGQQSQLCVQVQSLPEAYGEVPV